MLEFWDNVGGGGGVWETKGQAPALLANGNAMSKTKDLGVNYFLAFTQTSVVG